MTQLSILHAGPGMTIQDLGRPGWCAQGLPTGGAADRLALYEAAALLGTDPSQAVIEMMGMGGKFSVDQGTRFALTGAVMTADIDGEPVAPNQTVFLPAGAVLSIGAARAGVFCYLAFAGGIATQEVLQSRAAHLTAGIGGRLQTGQVLPLGPDPDRTRAPQKIAVADRLHGGTVRIMEGPQTHFFTEAQRTSFTGTIFHRNPRGNRQGIRLDHRGANFALADGLSHVSDLIVPGDIQITGAGVAYVLLTECQTIGGYPRIGSVIPADLPKIAQAAGGTPLSFAFITLAEADATAQSPEQLLKSLTKLCQPIVRDPHDIADLLRYQLISGATRGDDLDHTNNS